MRGSAWFMNCNLDRANILNIELIGMVIIFVVIAAIAYKAQ